MLRRRPRTERFDERAPLYTRVPFRFGDTVVDAGDLIPEGALTAKERGQWWRIGRADHTPPRLDVPTANAAAGASVVAHPMPVGSSQIDGMTEAELEAATAPAPRTVIRRRR